MLHASLFIDSADDLIALDGHIITKANYLEVFGHLSKKILRIRPQWKVASLDLPPQRDGIVSKYFDEINDKSELECSSIEDIWSWGSCQKRNFLDIFGSVQIERKEAKN